jgi:RNA polymerase sigma factor (sigma-70 family)
MSEPMTDAQIDAQSLAEYSRTRSPEAMGVLVRRYVDLVYATARRLVGDAHMAEDVTQAAFIILVKKANRIDPATLPGWLVTTTRLAARAAIKSQRTRSQYETRAAQMRSQTQTPKDEPTEDELLPVLDDALAKLNDADRTAVVMRFLQGRTFVEVGEAMGSSEEAACKRAGRAVEKLRSIFMKQGLVPSVGGLMVVLAAQQSPPASAAVAAGVTGAVSTGGAGTSAAIAKGVISIMKWAQIKLITLLAMGLIAIGGVGAGVSVVGRTKTQPPQLAATPATQPQISLARTLMLLDRRLPTFKANHERLETVLSNLANIDDLTIDTKWDDLAAAGITRDTPIDIRLADVSVMRILQVILGIDSAVAPAKQASFEVLDSGTILITSGKVMYTKYTSERQYEASDLLIPDPDGALSPRRVGDQLISIAELVEKTVDSPSWTADLCGGIKEVSGVDGATLVVVQTDQNHRAIGILLKQLREQNRTIRNQRVR